MGKTILGTNLGAGLAPDAIQRITNAHHHCSFVGEAIFVVAQPILNLAALTALTLNQLEYVSRTRLETTPATDAALLVQVDHENGCP
jgi:hypothetical protein